MVYFLLEKLWLVFVFFSYPVGACYENIVSAWQHGFVIENVCRTYPHSFLCSIQRKVPIRFARSMNYACWIFKLEKIVTSNKLCFFEGNTLFMIFWEKFENVSSRTKFLPLSPKRRSKTHPATTDIRKTSGSSGKHKSSFNKPHQDATLITLKRLQHRWFTVQRNH